MYLKTLITFFGVDHFVSDLNMFIKCLNVLLYKCVSSRILFVAVSP